MVVILFFVCSTTIHKDRERERERIKKGVVSEEGGKGGRVAAFVGYRNENPRKQALWLLSVHLALT